MDDPGWSWPAWKFGMKRDDLFTKLHDQYNTFPSSIQDPEAFHHDVFEISHEATTADEFHRLLADRKAQRLRELNDSLDSAAVEIIANPSLIGTAQWQYALQLFRTKSLDSLVRYFASYLPDDHPWHRSDHSTTADKPDPITNCRPTTTTFFEDEPNMTQEPLSISSIAAELPPSPRSMTMCSDSSVASPPDLAHHAYILDNLTPARTLSFSESEPDHFGLKDSCPHLHDDDTSQSSGPETPVSSVSDLSEMHHRKEFLAVTAEIHEVEEEVREEAEEGVVHIVARHEECSSSRSPSDTMELETPTPKPETSAASCFLDAKPSPLSSSSLRHRSLSPSRAYPFAHDSDSDCRRSPRSLRSRCHRDYSPEDKGRRKSPAEPTSRIQKPSPDPMRSRLRSRRQAGC